MFASSLCTLCTSLSVCTHLKPSLDASVLNNFRPISKLPFLSKILEKIISTQLISFLNNNDIFEKFQSGFRSLHSTETPLFCGVPQGSILGPLLFNIYMLPQKIIQTYNIDFHFYADYTQLYVPLRPGSSNVSGILSCLTEIKAWMSNNFLQLNDTKSEIIVFTSIGTSSGYIIKTSPLAQLTEVVQSCFVQLSS